MHGDVSIIFLNNSTTALFFFKFKNHFKSLNFYSMPHSVLFIVRKRLNLVFFIYIYICISFFSIF